MISANRVLKIIHIIVKTGLTEKTGSARIDGNTGMERAIWYRGRRQDIEEQKETVQGYF